MFRKSNGSPWPAPPLPPRRQLRLRRPCRPVMHLPIGPSAPPAKVPARSQRPGVQAVLFDLDGVLVDTAEFHYLAWKRLADELVIPFDRRINHAFRGVGRMDCLDKLLGPHGRFFADEEKRLLADRKNGYYLDLVKTLSPANLASGALQLLTTLKSASDGGIRIAVVSASKNARLVLSLLGVLPLFDQVIDGNDVTKSKPDPQGFLLAADKLRVPADRCIVLEDAESGIKAACAAGMPALGIGKGLTSAQYAVHQLSEVTLNLLEAVAGDPHARRPLLEDPPASESPL